MGIPVHSPDRPLTDEPRDSEHTAETGAAPAETTRSSRPLGLTADIDTVSGATAAVREIASAISSLTAARNFCDELHDRLETRVRDLRTVCENLTAADLRLGDVDLAATASRLTSALLCARTEAADAGLRGRRRPAARLIRP